ncbi:MAG: hypothetical protein ACU85V_02015 [Gammaproteobacteria bacterium]
MYRDAAARVVMEFATRSTSGIRPSSCPTFQVDQRKPLHYFALGEDCTVDGRSARFVVATLPGGPVTSLVLYRLLNGGAVSFRYASRDGGYHESRFTLRGSKQALEGALGALEVDPGEVDEGE